MLRSLAIGILLPALVVLASAGARALVARLRRMPPGDDAVCGRRVSGVLGALSIGAGAVIAFVSLEGWPAFPPAARWHWLVFMAIAAAGAGAIHALLPPPRVGGRWCGAATITAAGALGVAAALLLHPLAKIPHPWLWKVALGAVVASAFALTGGVAQGHRDRVLPIVLCGTCLAAAVVLIEARSAKFAQLMAALAAMAAAIVATPTRWRTAVSDHAATAVFVTLVPAWMAVGHFYDQRPVPVMAFVMVGIAPLAFPLIVQAPPFRMAGWRGWTLRIAAGLALPTIAVLCALLLAVPPEPAYEPW